MIKFLIIYVAASYLIMCLLGLFILYLYNTASHETKEKHNKIEGATIKACLLAPISILFVPYVIFIVGTKDDLSDV